MEETITLAGREYEIRKSARRKRIAVGIDASGAYFIGAPANCSADMLRKTLSKEIETIIARVEKRIGDIPQPREFREGELLYFRGVQYPLRWVSDTSAPIFQFDGYSFLLRSDARGSEAELLGRWYARRLFDRLRETLPAWTKRLKVAPTTVHVKNVRTLWGSCSSKNSITFCTRLALVPDDLFEYVVIHELTHLLHMNHSPAFWAEVARHIPDYKERRTKLRKNGQNYKWW